jgi:hypothetical protein
MWFAGVRAYAMIKKLFRLGNEFCMNGKEVCAEKGSIGLTAGYFSLYVFLYAFRTSLV